MQGFCWWSDVLSTVLTCGGGSCTFCHQLASAGVSEGAVLGNKGGCSGGNIALQKENRREGEEEPHIVGGEEEK